MKPSSLQVAFALALCCAAAGLRAEALGVAYEHGLDQEVVALLPQRSGPPLVLQRHFLEPRKSRIDPARASTDTLKLLDRSSGKAAAVLSYKADAPLWIGPPQPLSDGVVFAVRAGTEPAAVYKFASADRSVRRMPLPWEGRPGAGRAAEYERLFLLTNGLIGVRSEVGVHQAELWIGSGTEAVRLDTSIQNGDGRVISIDDVAEIDGRLVLLMLVAAGPAKAEVWMLGYDRSYSRANARAVRLETGALASGKISFVRSAQGIAAVRVSQRGSTYGRPTLKLFAVTGGTPLWSHELPGLLGADETAIVGVCRRSFLILRNSERERGRPAELESVLVGPNGQEALLERVKQPEGSSLLHSLAVADRERVWAYTNFSRLESTRRADGWYSWRGFQGSAEVADKYCRFD